MARPGDVGAVVGEHRLGREVAEHLRVGVDQAIEAWRVVNRSGAHGAHRYAPEQFGLTAARLRSGYDSYVKHFDVALET